MLNLLLNRERFENYLDHIYSHELKYLTLQ